MEHERARVFRVPVTMTIYSNDIERRRTRPDVQRLLDEGTGELRK
jgi:hypothetical protein